MANIRAEVILMWADGRYPFALKVPQVDELQRVTAKVVIEAMTGAGLPAVGLAKAVLDASGIGAIWTRLLSGTYLRTDIAETIRLGLIGGGMDAIGAKTKVETYVDNQPLASRDDVAAMNAGKLPHEMRDAVSNYGVAIAVVNAALFGLDELKKGRDEGNAGAGPATEDTSTSRLSIEPGEPSSEPPQTSET